MLNYLVPCVLQGSFALDHLQYVVKIVYLKYIGLASLRNRVLNLESLTVFNELSA